MLRAVLFDMDGVLVDSEPEYIRHEQLLARQLGFELTVREQSRYLGIRPLEMWMELKQKYGFDRNPLEIARAESKMMDEYYAHGTLHACEPSVALLRSCSQVGLKVAVASSSSQENVQHVVRRLGLEPYVDTVVSSCAAGKSKPAPDIFLLAMRRLGVEGSECVVVEDADSGIAAARAANVAGVIGILHPDRNQSLKGADMIVCSLSEVSLAVLRGLVE